MLRLDPLKPLPECAETFRMLVLLLRQRLFQRLDALLQEGVRRVLFDGRAGGPDQLPVDPWLAPVVHTS